MRPLRISLVRAIVVALATVTGGCILLVSPDPGGQHCHFADEVSTCGSCIKQRCEAYVDSACRAGRDVALAKLDACTTARDESCTALFADVSSVEAHNLGLCVAANCPGACAPALPNTLTRCVPEPFGDGRPCSCSLASPSNSFVCAEAALPRTLCCAPKGWPGAGLACTCQPLGCAPNGDGCSCFLTTYGPDDEKCEGAICCASATSCRCGSRACSQAAGERSVDSCTIAEMTCPPGRDHVATCIVPGP